MPANQYVHLNSVYLYFPIKIEKSTTKTSNIDENMITVKNVFALWIREIEAKRYGDDLQIVSNLTAKVYRYSDVMLKHKPKGGLKTFENTLLFSRNLVFFKNTTEPDAEIMYHAGSYIQYEQIRLSYLNKCLETALHSKKLSRIDLQKSLLKK